jgi:pre-mRNA-splicing factor RBM22/SLT11
MLDLSFGLPIVVRDAALKMVAPGPQSEVNREYYAQNNEKEIEEGRGGTEAYEKTDEKARELLKRLANSEPYYKKQRRMEAEGQDGQKKLEYGPGPIRTKDSRGSPATRGQRVGRGGGRSRPFPGTAQLPITPQDILPPADPNITSLFVTGVEDDLPEHALRTFFSPFGTIRSLICSHRSHCAFINYATREGAEKAAEACQGKAVIQGCPLRVQWGKPKPLDNMDREERMKLAREGRAMVATGGGQTGRRAITGPSDEAAQEEESGSLAVAAPPGAGNVQYASLAGD